MKIVVTGGMGFIGGKLVRRLLSGGHQVRVLDSLTPQIHGEAPVVEVLDGVEFLRVDVRELGERHDLLEGFDAVVHLAAETGTAQSMYRIRHYVDVNEGGTAALLEGLSKCEQRPRRIVLASSRSVYGEGQSLQNPYTGIISIFVNRMRQGLMLPIYEDGLETRDFVHVDDVTAAVVAALGESVPAGSVCNVGSGVATSVIALAEKLSEAAGLSPEIKVTGQFRVGDIRHNFADIEAARRLLGFTPQISLDEGLRRFCEWAAGQPAYQDGLDRATEELRAKGLGS